MVQDIRPLNFYIVTEKLRHSRVPKVWDENNTYTRIKKALKAWYNSSRLHTSLFLSMSTVKYVYLQLHV